MAIATPGSLPALMDQLVALERQVLPNVYRWEPVGQANPPCIFNWLSPSPFEHRDTQRWRDTVNIVATIGIRRSDFDKDMRVIETYADTFRDVLDQPLGMRPPFTGLKATSSATWGRRTLMAMRAREVGGVNLLCIDFQIEFLLDRLLQP